MKMVHFYSRVELLKPKFTMVSTSFKPYVGQTDLAYNFSNDDTPSTTDVTLHGLTKAHSDKFKKDAQVDIYAGYYNEDFTQNKVRQLVHGTITTINPRKNDAGDIQLTFTMQDGEKYDDLKPIKVKKSKKVRLVASQKSLESQIRKYNSAMTKKFNLWRDKHPHLTDKQVSAERKKYTKAKKVKRTQLSSAWNKQRKYLNTHKKYQIKTTYEFLSFKAGTKGSTIIRSIAKHAGIKVQTIKLVYDRVYQNGYTAKKKPMACIKEIAADCKSNTYWWHGYLQIKDFVQQKKLNYVATTKTGLLDPPEYQEDSDDGQTWQIDLLFNPEITTGSVFYVKHEMLTGWVIVISGSSTSSAGGTPTTQVNVQLFSEYKKKQKKTVDKQKAVDKKAAAKKAKQDKAKRDKARAKRKKRADKKKKSADKKKKAS